MKHLAVILVAGTLAALAGAAHARVHVVRSAQTIAYDSPGAARRARNVAIEGDSAIVILDLGSHRQAVLFRRGTDGQWTQARVLLDVTTSASGPDELALADGVAAIRIGDVMHVFERSGSNWTESNVAGTPRPAPGLVTSSRRILAGRRGCNYDANVFSKSVGSGVWGVSGRASGAIGECNDHGAGLDLEGDVALVINPPTNDIREYRRNGTALAWPQVGTLVPPAGVTLQQWMTPTLRGDVAVIDGGHFFRRVGGAWDYQGRILPLDSAGGTNVGSPDYRGDLLASIAGWNSEQSNDQPYLYRQNAAGGFDHVAILATSGQTSYVDLSGNTAIASSLDAWTDQIFLQFYTLPTPIVAPNAIANDFEANDVSGFQQTSGSNFALATRGTNRLYRQSATTGESRAVLTDSDWSNYQSVEADITPTAFDGADRWFGVAVRYVDAANFYYLTLRSSNRLELKRMVNGQFTTLAWRTLPVTLGSTYRLKLSINGSSLEGIVMGVGGLDATDTTHTHGRAALMTYRTRADFDNVYAAPTLSLPLAYKQPGAWGTEWTYQGGQWNWVELPFPYPDDVGEAQQSTSGDARAFFGTPTDNQRIDASIRLDAYIPSPSGAWFGVLARWVDSRNFYYLTLRSNNRLEIRKQVNGVVTVLKSVPFTAEPGRFYGLRFEVLGNELHAFVDGAFVAGAIDGDIATGQYGLGSYRTAFTYRWVQVGQP